MVFENYRDKIIDDFVEDYHNCCTLARNLTEEEIKDIHNRFEEHRECFENNYEEYCKEDAELISSCIYGDNISASIECHCCNSVIIDDFIIADDDIEQIIDRR